jgi:hypothetical protein
MKLCQHCLQHRATKADQLCSICHLCPSVRSRYVGTAPSLKRPKRKRLSPYSTRARPGSAEKIAVMASRWEQGFDLFHPHDAQV